MEYEVVWMYRRTRDVYDSAFRAFGKLGYRKIGRDVILDEETVVILLARTWFRKKLFDLKVELNRKLRKFR